MKMDMFSEILGQTVFTIDLARSTIAESIGSSKDMAFTQLTKAATSFAK